MKIIPIKNGARAFTVNKNGKNVELRQLNKGELGFNGRRTLAFFKPFSLMNPDNKIDVINKDGSTFSGYIASRNTTSLYQYIINLKKEGKFDEWFKEYSRLGYYYFKGRKWQIAMTLNCCETACGKEPIIFLKSHENNEAIIIKQTGENYIVHTILDPKIIYAAPIWLEVTDENINQQINIMSEEKCATSAAKAIKELREQMDYVRQNVKASDLEDEIKAAEQQVQSAEYNLHQLLAMREWLRQGEEDEGELSIGNAAFVFNTM